MLDLDRVGHVRAHGTAGLNRMWEQLRADDDPIELPVYGGRMTHGHWLPRRPDPEEQRDRVYLLVLTRGLRVPPPEMTAVAEQAP